MPTLAQIFRPTGKGSLAELLGLIVPQTTSAVPLPERPGDPGYDPNTLATILTDPSVLDSPWTKALRAVVNTGERIGEGVKGMVTGGSAQPGPSAENLGAMLAAAGSLAKIVFHGSPHVFDKFDMSKVGTGERAQAYGHGLYLADSPAVAREYQNLGGRDVLVNGKPRTQAKLTSAQRQILDYFESNAIDPRTADFGEVGDAFMRASVRGPGTPKQQWDRFRAEFDKLKPMLSAGKSKGALYDVDLPDSAIANMLDWDAPLSQQPESVRKTLVRLVPDAKPTETGGILYNRIGRTLNDQFGTTAGENARQWATEELVKHGIPGIKYYDGMSRGKGQGTRNYVVFDDQLPKIVKVER